MGWTAELHPRGKKGTTTGGKFVAQGDGGMPKGTLSYDPKTGKGTGYGVRGGDRKVRQLQQQLNRLGVTDSHGRPLAIDGKLGPLTTSAVKDLQRRLGVKADGMVTPALLSQIKNLKTTPAKKARRKRATASEETEMADRTTDAVINGERTFDEVRDLVRDALATRIQQGTGQMYVYCYIADLTAAQVVYSCEGADDLMQCSYEIGSDGAVTLGDPVQVVRTYAPATTGTAEPAGEDMSAMESVADRTEARVLEAKGTDADGGRVFRVRIIAYGTSKNRRRYTESVMRKAAPLYEGAKAYDHHRTDEELRTSTINGLVGHYRSVEAAADGLYGDLHLLPSATHAAETLDAAIAAQAAGLEPPVGISHDVQATFTTVVEGGQRVQEATQIVSVDSADIVAKPSAGGKAVRAVAGGITTEDEESDVTTTAAVLAALREASDDELAAAGLARPATKTTESTTGPVTRAVETTETVREATHSKTSPLGKLLIRQAVTDAGLPDAVVESLTGQLADRFTEGDIETAIAGVKGLWATVERAGLAPTVGNVQVTKESHDKKIQALDDFFAANGKGYHSFREAVIDITGIRRRNADEDFNRAVLRECVGSSPFDSALRSTESLTAASFDAVLGDSITRRMVAEYGRPSLQTWRQIVSATPTVNDFRTQRVGRVGGYGTLPAVNEGGAYQPLTSPSDEEATYALTKRGGTEDLTLEMIANDDIRAIQKIPFKLGLAAAQTLYRFVWDMLPNNTTCTFDSTALFHTNHANTDNPAVLGQSTLSTGRKKMRKQAAYGDTSDVLSIVPMFLVVPSDLEEIAFQLCTSAVAVPSTPAGPSDTPNLHQGLKPIVIDYYSDTNDWYLVADPSLCPTIEVGFYQGRQEPELFTQSDQTVGSMFNADSLTYKIRHIYSGTVIDYRGFYRGAN